MSAPTVSFIVPCYKLAHLLPECINSILSQSLGDFEILIMDDCSPDDTPAVARSFSDIRVKYIRNEPNLGHLRNYNKGISLAQGKYIWLISADDQLVKSTALEQYVAMMESHPSVGFTCSTAVEIRDSGESTIAGYSRQAERDTVFHGHDLLGRLLYSNSIVASSGLVRRTCYEAFGAFPLDLPYAGDWYLWCLFALHYDVGYCSEPLVAYRIHGQSMTESLLNQDVHICVNDCLSVLWRIRQKSLDAAHTAVADKCRRAICYAYAQEILGRRYRGCHSRMSIPECQESIRTFTTEGNDFMLGGVYESLADISLQDGRRPQAIDFYSKAIRCRPYEARLYAKAGLLRLGSAGVNIRMWINALRSQCSIN